MAKGPDFKKLKNPHTVVPKTLPLNFGGVLGEGVRTLGGF